MTQGRDVHDLLRMQKMKNSQEAAAKKTAAAARKAAKAAAEGDSKQAVTPNGKAAGLNGHLENGKSAGKRSASSASPGSAAKRLRK